MLRRMFRDHPAKVGESYVEHMVFAFGFSARLFRAAAAAFIHGVVPCLHETTASTAVLDMNDELRARRASMAQGSGERAIAS
ncbi:MAG TPA: DUF6356 family protein [Aestuariivirga sp.]|nr:hypothetical protein [Alphaproteobacteria bacterium]HRX36352.1 DUF6356 family protein [Aestuariivirga sp.]